MDDLTDPIVVKNYSKDEQLEWARNYGMLLWEEHGDNQIVREMTEEENEKDKKKAWEVVYEENENKINFDVKQISEENDFQDQLIMAIKEGFIEAYESASKS